MQPYFVDIQRGSLHDGPGIRTTFFMKGCPLRCRWCHNPESWSVLPQLSFHEDSCSLCRQCESVCPHQVHQFRDGKHLVDFGRCKRCKACVKACPGHALKIIGTAYSCEELLAIALRDMPFYEQSGGGITLSGGEVLLQADFAAGFLEMCQENEIHTCVETSGYGTAAAFQKILPVTDLLYFDWKVSDPALAGSYLGVALDPVLENLALADHAGANIVLRCPVIPGVNDTQEHFISICDLMRRYPSIREAQLLPYHTFGLAKAHNIGTRQEAFHVPDEAQIYSWEQWFAGQEEAIARRVYVEQ